MPVTKKPVKGPFRVVNPRGIPKGRHVIRDGETRYFEGDAYDGEKAEMWLGRGFIKAGLPKSGKIEEAKGG